MDHIISANLAFGRREKNYWGYKKLQGYKKPHSKNLWGAAKKWAGAPNGNVTPLDKKLFQTAAEFQR